MAKETWPSLEPSLEQFELQVRKTTRNEKRHELGLIENLFNRYLSGFRALNSFKAGEYSQLKLAWLLLVVRSFKSLRCAYDLLQKGYYSQALMLIRSAEEDYLICKHCEINLGTINALLAGKGKLKRFQDMANDISTGFGENWRINYGQLSEIAHPRKSAMGMGANWEANRLNLGLDYNENHFVVTCQALLWSAARVTEFVIKLLGDGAEQWQRDSYLPLREANDYVERVTQTYEGDN